jgi:hypothetical protein
MSSAIHNLQAAIVDGKTPMTQLLRQTKLIAAKLNLEDVERWVDLELNGYPKDAPLPRYRNYATSSIVVHTPNGGWEFAGNCCESFPCAWPIADIEAKSKIKTLTTAISDLPATNGLGSPINLPRRIVLDGAQFMQILEAVKNKLLQWTTELQKRGIKGEDMDFDEKEKESAAQQVFNIGTVHGIVGNATNSQVNVHIAGSYNELNIQVSAIRAVEAALAAEIAKKNPLGEARARANEAEKSLRKVREELEDEKKPDPARVLKWLEQAKYALKAFGLTKEIIDAGQKLEEAFHISDWLGSALS